MRNIQIINITNKSYNEILDLLDKYVNNSTIICFEYNGKLFYSKEESIEDFKREYENLNKKYDGRAVLEQNDFLWRLQATSYVVADKRYEFMDYVSSVCLNLYNGNKIIDLAMEIMGCLEEKDFAEKMAKVIDNSDLPQESIGIAKYIVARFYKRSFNYLPYMSGGYYLNRDTGETMSLEDAHSQSMER